MSDSNFFRNATVPNSLSRRISAGIGGGLGLGACGLKVGFCSGTFYTFTAV